MLNRIKVGRGPPAMTHLFYTDDILVTCKAHSTDAKAIKTVLDGFGDWSGLKANGDKSSILFSPSTDKSLKAYIKGIMGFKEMKRGAMYLRNSLVLGKWKSEEFHKLKERIQHRLEGWQSQLLSRAGMVVLIKNVVQSIPTFSMATFRIPKQICDCLDSLVMRFWWGVKQEQKRFMALRKWTDICQPKSCGGLDFRLFYEFNTAMLAKLDWKIASGEQSLWCNILRSKYLSGENFFEHQIPQGASGVWRGIVSAKEAVSRGACYSLGNSLAFNPWRSPWVPGIKGHMPQLRDGVDRRAFCCVAQLWDDEVNDWNVQLLNTLCDSESVINCFGMVPW